MSQYKKVSTRHKGGIKPILRKGKRVEKDEIQALILKLFKNQKSMSLGDVVAHLQVEKEDYRKLIYRIFTEFVDQGILTQEGVTRGRKYSLKQDKEGDKDLPEVLDQSLFQEIPLSSASKELIKYLSKPVYVRDIVPYHVEFLRSYSPNKDYYLSTESREELKALSHIENTTRPAGTYARQILSRFLIDLSWNSSRLEGNTYSLLETKLLIEKGEWAEGKDLLETQMILNHKNAIEYMVEISDEDRINAHEIYSLHALLSENLLEDHSASGRLRNIAVRISGSQYMPIENPHLIKEYFDLFVEKLNLIKDPFEQSFFALIHVSYLQGFEDVNKRTSRMLANMPLIKHNLTPFSFIGVPEQEYVTSLLGIYEKNDVSLLTDLYLWAYKRSCQRYSAIQQVMGKPHSFKMKYRSVIQSIIRKMILEKIREKEMTLEIRSFLNGLSLPEKDKKNLFEVIQMDILSLHEGNIAVYKIKPNEFKVWKELEN